MHIKYKFAQRFTTSWLRRQIHFNSQIGYPYCLRNIFYLIDVCSNLTRTTYEFFYVRAKYSATTPRFSSSFAHRTPINRFNHSTYSNRRSTLKKRIQYQSSFVAADRSNKSHCCQTNLPRSFCRSIPFVAFICCTQSCTSFRLRVNTTSEHSPIDKRASVRSLNLRLS